MGRNEGRRDEEGPENRLASGRVMVVGGRVPAPKGSIVIRGNEVWSGLVWSSRTTPQMWALAEGSMYRRRLVC